MNWDFLKDLITTVLSAAAVGISIWAILKSCSVDRRQKKYLDIQISEHVRKEEDRKKADLYGEVRKTEPSTYKLIIKNKGRASATNVSIIFPEDLDKNGNSILTDKPIQISSLEPGKSLSYLVALDKNSLQEFRAVFSWDDDFKKGQEKDGSIFIIR